MQAPFRTLFLRWSICRSRFAIVKKNIVADFHFRHGFAVGGSGISGEKRKLRPGKDEGGASLDALFDLLEECGGQIGRRFFEPYHTFARIL